MEDKGLQDTGKKVERSRKIKSIIGMVISAPVFVFLFACGGMSDERGQQATFFISSLMAIAIFLRFGMSAMRPPKVLASTHDFVVVSREAKERRAQSTHVKAKQAERANAVEDASVALVKRDIYQHMEDAAGSGEFGVRLVFNSDREMIVERAMHELMDQTDFKWKRVEDARASSCAFQIRWDCDPQDAMERIVVKHV